jgi:hypothetical protein
VALGKAPFYNEIMKKIIFLMTLALILAGCGGNTPQDVGVLPTEVVLPTLTPTLSPTVTLTGTQPATSTPTQTPTSTFTVTVTVTPSITITDTPTSTATITPSPSPSVGALGLLAQLAANATPIPQTFLPPVVTGAVPTTPAAQVTCASLRGICNGLQQ